MFVSLKKDFTSQQREDFIRETWRKLGEELYSICQSSKKINAVIKIKLTKSVCEEYVRQQIDPFLKSFSSGEFNLSFNEDHAISLANTIASFSSEDYNELLEQIEAERQNYDANRVKKEPAVL